ncbi:hypothetical protein D9M71_201690 [compost metagenome]
MGCRQAIGILRVSQLVGVVGHDHFLLAHQRPVVQVQRAGGPGVRGIVGQDRDQFDAALSRQVLPAAPRLLQGVHGIFKHDRLTGPSCRASVGQLHLIVEVLVADRLRHVFVHREGDERLACDRQARHASGVNVPGVVLGVDADALVAQQEVPHRLGARLRDRERYAGQYIVDGHSTLERLGGGGVLAAVTQYRLR